MIHIVALSGGKDSTALAIRLSELNPDIDYQYICTPTGDELQEMEEHWDKLESILGKKIIKLTNGTLYSWIDFYNALPNWRMRWCTRLLKIQPCLTYIKSLKVKPVLYVGLRADEPTRKGIYSENVITKFPLKDWGWDLQKVQNYLEKKCIKIPKRTDCALCFYQKIGEWYYLWRDHRSIFKKAIDLEKKTGHTFRNPNKKTWGSNLQEMSNLFEKGKKPRKVTDQIPLFDSEFISCRVCRL